MLITTYGDNCVDIYDRSKRYAGGNALNTAVALSRNGVDTAYLGAVGSDISGWFITERLIRQHIGISGLRVIPGPTGWTRVTIREGERCFLADHPGVQIEHRLTSRDQRTLSESNVIHCTGFTNWSESTRNSFGDYHGYVLDQLSSASASGAFVSMDFSSYRDEELYISAGGLVDLAFYSAPDISDEALTGMIKELSRYFPITVVTRGARGSIATDGKRIWVQQPCSVQVKDTLGAGDAFIGAFLASCAADHSIPGALKHASVYAAEVCSREGPW